MTDYPPIWNTALPPVDYAARVRRLEFELYKAEHGMGMPYDRERVQALRQQIKLARHNAELDAITSDREEGR